MYTQPAEIDYELPIIPQTTKEDAAGNSETVLLVEDEAFVREVTREVLVSAGYLLLTAKNSAEAAEIYERHGREINLLLSDVILPGEDGRMLAEKLQQKNPLLKVLLVTGYGEQMARKESGRAECLAKPFSSNVLLQRIRRILDQKLSLA